MKKPHPASSCIALAFILACSGRGSDEGELDGTHAATSAETTTAETTSERPQSAEADPTPSAPVRDKLTCPSGCVKVSATPPSPTCCNCNGQDRTWKRSTWSPTTWLCQ